MRFARQMRGFVFGLSVRSAGIARDLRRVVFGLAVRSTGGVHDLRSVFGVANRRNGGTHELRRVVFGLAFRSVFGRLAYVDETAGLAHAVIVAVTRLAWRGRAGQLRGVRTRGFLVSRRCALGALQLCLLYLFLLDIG